MQAITELWTLTFFILFSSQMTFNSLYVLYLISVFLFFNKMIISTSTVYAFIVYLLRHDCNLVSLLCKFSPFTYWIWLLIIFLKHFTSSHWDDPFFFSFCFFVFLEGHSSSFTEKPSWRHRLMFATPWEGEQFREDRKWGGGADWVS